MPQKRGALAVAAEEPESRQVGTEQPVRVAAHRILGDAERRAEHARLGEVVARRRGEREDEVAGGADLCRERRESRQVGLEVLERFRAAHPDQQPRAGRADDARRHARVETLGGERQRIEHREAFAVVQLAADRRGAAADRDAAILIAAAHFDVHDAGLGFLPLPARRVVPARQHVLRSDRGVADEAGFAARGEEARAHRVIVGVGREDEGGLGVVELARDGEHLRFRERVGVEHDAGRITGEGLTGERIDLMDLDLPRHLPIRRFRAEPDQF